MRGWAKYEVLVRGGEQGRNLLKWLANKQGYPYVKVTKRSSFLGFHAYPHAHPLLTTPTSNPQVSSQLLLPAMALHSPISGFSVIRTLAIITIY